MSVKRLSYTRWFVRAGVNFSFNTNWNKIVLALSSIIKSDIEKDITKSEVKAFFYQMARIKTGFMVVFWISLGTL